MTIYDPKARAPDLIEAGVIVAEDRDVIIAEINRVYEEGVKAAPALTPELLREFRRIIKSVEVHGVCLGCQQNIDPKRDLCYDCLHLLQQGFVVGAKGADGWEGGFAGFLKRWKARRTAVRNRHERTTT